MTGSRLVCAAGLAVLSACVPTPGTAPSADRSEQSGERAAATPSRTLKIVVRYEVNDLAPKISGQSSPSLTRRVFNADLALVDSKGKVIPYLAESLPQLNTESWRVFPDGRMETTYRLRPFLTWQDGTPLTADDFAFTHRAYTVPGLALFLPTPQDQMEEIVAADPRTVVIRWRALYPDANALVDEDFGPLPRHLMEQPFNTFERDTSTRDALVSHRYWTTDYVHAGPYRLVHWEPGAYLEGEAFDGHALGRPRIDRVVVQIFGDENTVLSNLLAENVHYTSRLSLRFEHGLVLRREWGHAAKGSIFLDPNPTVHAAFQFRLDSLKTPALMDLRVRRALAHAVDKDELNHGLFEGEGIIAHSFTSPQFAYYAEVDRSVMKYPYDARRVEQLMQEAGFARDRAGFFADAGQRLQPDFWVTAGSLFEKQLAIHTDQWQRAGIDLQPWAIPVAQTRDNSTRMLFPGILSHGVATTEQNALLNMTTEHIGTAANRWTGSNRGGWSNPDYDRLWTAYSTTLDRTERIGHLVQMMKVRSELLPSIPLFFNSSIIAHVAALRGPTTITPNTLPHWNIHEWELR